MKSLPDFIQDLEPADFYEDPDALDRFTERLRTYLGNDLVDRHSELVNASDDGYPNPDSPWLSLRLGITPGHKPKLIVFNCSLL